MASLTVRQLDDKLKKLLRLRAARHDRSMEDEVRVILRQSAEQAGGEILERFEPPAQPMRPTSRVSAAEPGNGAPSGRRFSGASNCTSAPRAIPGAFSTAP